MRSFKAIERRFGPNVTINSDPAWSFRRGFGL
jgi:hypothetical protein